jgi:hypothetical protein
MSRILRHMESKDLHWGMPDNLRMAIRHTIS